jgi:hypothetical protein
MDWHYAPVASAFTGKVGLSTLYGQLTTNVIIDVRPLPVKPVGRTHVMFEQDRVSAISHRLLRLVYGDRWLAESFHFNTAEKPGAEI